MSEKYHWLAQKTVRSHPRLRRVQDLTELRESTVGQMRASAAHGKSVRSHPRLRRVQDLTELREATVGQMRASAAHALQKTVRSHPRLRRVQDLTELREATVGQMRVSAAHGKSVRSHPRHRRGQGLTELRKCVSLILVAIALVAIAIPDAGAKTIKGKVVDIDSQPLVGVSVIPDQSGKGTITDESGEYELTEADNISRLTFSSVGYQSAQYRIANLPETVVLQAMYYRGTDILVRSDRAAPGITPIAYQDFSSEDIKRDYTVGEFPLLLSTTPNLYSYSDAGSSLGYSYTKIRGFDDKRIVTYVNGVPLNDPEDQATYFVDLPDFAANVSDIQVQRGVGNSLYGDASFGGSINIVTNSFNRERKTTVTAGYGEYTSGGESVSDVYKQSIEYASGLIDGRWLFSGRFSRQKTGGYRHNSWYEGWAYYFSVARLDPRMTTELHVYGGPMRMHLAYWGASRDAIEADRRTNPLTYEQRDG